MTVTSSGLTSGVIKTVGIAAAREQMFAIMQRFMNVKDSVNKTRQTLCDDWVGEGRNEFEVQYRLLISKVDDIGQNLEEMYQALVDAEATYQEGDASLNQEIVMSM